MSFPRNYIKISLCCPHLIKNMYKEIEDHSKRQESYIINTVKSLVALGLNCFILSDATLWFENLVVILANPYNDKSMVQALIYFKSQRGSIKEYLKDNIQDTVFSGFFS